MRINISKDERRLEKLKTMLKENRENEYQSNVYNDIHEEIWYLSYIIKNDHNLKEKGVKK